MADRSPMYKNLCNMANSPRKARAAGMNASAGSSAAQDAVASSTGKQGKLALLTSSASNAELATVLLARRRGGASDLLEQWKRLCEHVRVSSKGEDCNEDCNGRGIIFRKPMASGETLVDPAAHFFTLREKAPKGSGRDPWWKEVPNLESYNALSIGDNCKGFFLVGDRPVKGFCTTTFFMNEIGKEKYIMEKLNAGVSLSKIQPNVKWKRNGNQLEWRLLRDVKEGEEAITVYDSFDASEFKRMKMRVYKRWESQRNRKGGGGGAGILRGTGSIALLEGELEHGLANEGHGYGKGKGAKEEEEGARDEEVEAKLAAMRAENAAMKAEHAAMQAKLKEKEAAIAAMTKQLAAARGSGAGAGTGVIL